MKFLLFADLHQFQEEDLGKIDDEFDIIVFLGDIDPVHIGRILSTFPEKPSFCVLGNHDDRNTVSSANGMARLDSRLKDQTLMYPLKELNLRKEVYGNVSFTAIEGSVLYKTNQIGYTQKDAMSLVLPPADILFSHESGYRFLRPKRYDKAHEGYKAITKYLKKIKPKYHIFGHHHRNTEFQKYKTKCFCVYGCSVFDANTGTMINLF